MSGAAICGLWIDGAGRARVAVAADDGPRQELTEPFRPFAWVDSSAEIVPAPGIEIELLAGRERFSRLVHAASIEAHDALLKSLREESQVDSIRPLESQFLLQHRRRLFEGLPFARLRRCQVAFEIAEEQGGDAGPVRRVAAIGLACGQPGNVLTAKPGDVGEKALLDEFARSLSAMDPDVIEGHGLHRGGLEFLRDRCRAVKANVVWGRFGQKPSIRSARLKAAERQIDLRRCDLPGRPVVDTSLLAQLYDISTREMESYELSDCAEYFEIAEAPAGESVLAAQLRQVKGLGDILLPTYFEQVKTFPITLQEATLRGTTSKIDLLFLERYYHERHSYPMPGEVAPFEGGYTKSFEEGLFHHVLHFDVASLYPNLLLNIGRNPRNDPLGVFIPMLRSLLEYRLKYKELARSSPNPDERAEAQARQTSFKILINSFYGYLGFSAAKFGDGDLAAEVTRQGRELLLRLIEEFSRLGCRLLEADTDGIYLSSEKYFSDPDALLKQAERVLPQGISLEYDGKYPSMFCYKAKNYALYDGNEIVRRGSAFRSRSVEPYLQRLTEGFLRFILGADSASPTTLADEYRRRIVAGELPVTEIAKSEILSQAPDIYERFVAGGGKPRRAAAEVALQMSPRPRMGDRVPYFVTTRAKGQTSDWQRARPLSAHNQAKVPYDAAFYSAKIDDWLEKYGRFLGDAPRSGTQGEITL